MYRLSQHPVDPNIAWADPDGRERGKGSGPPGKTQVIWVSIWNMRMLDPLWNFVENYHFL